MDDLAPLAVLVTARLSEAVKLCKIDASACIDKLHLCCSRMENIGAILFQSDKVCSRFPETIVWSNNEHQSLLLSSYSDSVPLRLNPYAMSRSLNGVSKDIPSRLALEKSFARELNSQPVGLVAARTHHSMTSGDSQPMTVCCSRLLSRESMSALPANHRAIRNERASRRIKLWLLGGCRVDVLRNRAGESLAARMPSCSAVMAWISRSRISLSSDISRCYSIETRLA